MRFAPLSRPVLISVVVASLTALVACSDDDDSSGSKDPTSSCKDLCTGAGFSSSRVDVQSNETNCFCSGGTGTVTDAACTTMCKGSGKSKAQTFKADKNAANMDSCQCS